MATHISKVRRHLPLTIHHRPSLLRPPSLLLTQSLSTAPQSDQSTNVENEPSSPSLDPKLLSQIYNTNRSLYKKSVSNLRKSYAAEISAQTARNAALASEAEARQKRSVLERRRLKAIKAARNARLQLEKADERRIQWERELEMTQTLRDKKKEVMNLARQRVVDLLEEECHLWLTNEMEVEMALGNEDAGQILWGRRGGMIGAPSGVVSMIFVCVC